MDRHAGHGRVRGGLERHARPFGQVRPSPTPRNEHHVLAGPVAWTEAVWRGSAWAAHGTGSTSDRAREAGSCSTCHREGSRRRTAARYPLLARTAGCGRTRGSAGPMKIGLPTIQGTGGVPGAFASFASTRYTALTGDAACSNRRCPLSDAATTRPLRRRTSDTPGALATSASRIAASPTGRSSPTSA